MNRERVRALGCGCLWVVVMLLILFLLGALVPYVSQVLRTL